MNKPEIQETNQERTPALAGAPGSEVPTPRTDKWEYEQACNFDVPWEEHCRQLEREVLRLGAALNEQNERWGLYGNESQAALRSFKELNASAGLPNDRDQAQPEKPLNQ